MDYYIYKFAFGISKDYEYRETMPYKREPEFMEVSPKALIPGIKDEMQTKLEINMIFIDKK